MHLKAWRKTNKKLNIINDEPVDYNFPTAVKEKKSLFPEDYNEEDEKRMNIIGQNGNDGEHYDDLDKNDINKDGIVDEQDLKSLITERDKFPINSDTWNRLDQEVSRFKKRYNILDDDLTITY